MILPITDAVRRVGLSEDEISALIEVCENFSTLFYEDNYREPYTRARKVRLERIVRKLREASRQPWNRDSMRVRS